MRRSVWIIGAALLVTCRPPATNRGVYLSRLPLGSDWGLPVPAANPLQCDRVALGRRLFVDSLLSRGGAVACATCHQPERAFTDGRSLSLGDSGAIGRRNAPTLLGRAYGQSHFWDGRVLTLEEQVILPLTNRRELANTRAEVERRLDADPSYRRDFVRAFGSSDVTVDRIAQALASFVRTLVTGDSPVDRFTILHDSSALSPAARRGFDLFRGKAGCVRCHEPWRFTDERFHNTGIAWKNASYQDSGRFGVTGQRDDLGAFKTPTLRNVALTAPYMHDGSVATLREVIEFYDRGGNANANLDPLLRPLHLMPDEKAALLALLESLTGVVNPAVVPGCPSSRH
jgi:cytochrome c peroxidase